MSRRVPFRRRRDGSLEARLTDPETQLLGNVARSMREVVEGDADDPAVKRLFPDAYFDDAEAQESWRSMTRDDLATARLDAARRVGESLDGAPRKRGEAVVTLGEEDVAAWLGVINDARLVLGVRLGVTEEMNDTALPPDDPRRAAFDVYVYLGWLQTELLHALDPTLEEAYGAEW